MVKRKGMGGDQHRKEIILWRINSFVAQKFKFIKGSCDCLITQGLYVSL